MSPHFMWVSFCGLDLWYSQVCIGLYWLSLVFAGLYLTRDIIHRVRDYDYWEIGNQITHYVQAQHNSATIHEALQLT